MSANEVEYSPDFEASENDTSQLVSGQSEILDEADSATITSKVEEKKSPPFTAESGGADKSASEPRSQVDASLSQDESPATKNKELEEIEDIIRKLERLEKAQTLLEDALHLSDAEHDLNDISERSERSVASRSVASSSFRSGRKSVSKTSNQVSPGSDDGGPQYDQDLSEAINTGLASIQDIIDKEQVQPEPNHVGRPPSPPSVSASSELKSKKSVSRSQSSRSQIRKNRVIMSSKIIDGSGDHNGENRQSAFPVVDLPDTVSKLKSEIARQETLILAYQKENEKLYGQLKAAQEEIQTKDARHEEEVNGLKTEIASLKLNRLASVTGASGSSSPRLGSAHKGELDRLNEELTAKSLMIVELRKEVALLRVEKESRPASAKRVKSPTLSINKEKEYQDKIRQLQKQVRTLQRILYSKDSVKPSTPTTNSRPGLATKGRALSLGKFEVNRRATSATSVDDDAVKKMEEKMRNERAEFQRQLNTKQSMVEEKELQINALKLEVSKLQNEPSREVNQDHEAESAILEQLQNRLLNQSEIIQTLKDQLNSYKDMEQERNNLRKEVGVLESRLKDLQKKLTRAENVARPSFRAGSAPAKHTDTTKPAMNQEKEKDYQKQIQNLQKQVRTLQKILYNKDPSAIPTSAPGLSRLTLSADNKDDMFGGQQRSKSAVKPDNIKKATATPAPKPNYNAQVLQATFEQERQELEQLLEHKQRQIEDRDRQIRELKSKLSATIEENSWIASESATEKANYEEFRAKLTTQSKIIESLQQRLASYGNIEAEKCLLKKEISQLEFRIKDLQRRLARAENLARPENEVLATLSEKVEDLHTRYYYRERQLDTLLDRLSVKTGAVMSPRSLNSFRSRNGNLSSGSSGIPREDFGFIPVTRQHNNNGVDLGNLSPSATLHMIPHRDVPEM